MSRNLIIPTSILGTRQWEDRFVVDRYGGINVFQFGITAFLNAAKQGPHQTHNSQCVELRNVTLHLRGLEYSIKASAV